MTGSPRCAEVPGCAATHGGKTPACRCSGEWGPFNLEIIDRVQLPATLLPGKYVLSWRWDCEESNQVFSSCSDIVIKGRADIETSATVAASPLRCTGESATLLLSECAAWMDLYDGTNGEHWKWCSSFRTDPCGCDDFDSVSCSADGRHITKL